jgi:glutamyl-tRNA synthetase
MKISHAFRGEEWLPSAPVHVLLWQWLFGLENMPQWAHFPLILGPHGKLSKREGAKYGYPVFAMNWADPKTGELTGGFKEKGFLPEAFINLLALLGWNDGSEKEIFSKEELVQAFSMERVHSGGAKFDYEKAKWFNHEWIKRLDLKVLVKRVESLFETDAVALAQRDLLSKIIELVRDRCVLLPDFVEQSSIFFEAPESLDIAAVKPKWNDEKKEFFILYIEKLTATASWDVAALESSFKELAVEKNIKPGDLQLPFRIMLVGGKFGPPVFHIAALLGRTETIRRINHALKLF